MMNENMNSLESEVRYYCRLFPDVFSTAIGSHMYSTDRKKYLDFFCGSGSLNYGHNEPGMKSALINYISSNGVINSLDQMTDAKISFIETFNKVILEPRNLQYRMQFCGPTGTNAIEASIKLARKFTGREKIAYFENSFHGMTYGAMSISGIKSKNLNPEYRKNTICFPYATDKNSIEDLRKYVEVCDSLELPAAIVLETLQAEGGMRVASPDWLTSIQTLCRENRILLIVDDIQAGCGRTGTFFSFEGLDVYPDIVCLSKSLSGIGLPLSINLVKPEIDCWNPGEHNGTFRGNNLAFVAATSALGFWDLDYHFEEQINEKSSYLQSNFTYLNNNLEVQLTGKGLMRGLRFRSPSNSVAVQKRLFEKGLLVDTCGIDNQVVKVMPPLNISTVDLKEGLVIINRVLHEIIPITKSTV